MTRIPPAELDRLKREVPLVRLVEEAGVKLSGHGDNLCGLCPFHDDHDPSLVVSPSKNLWNCLGACQTGGSVVDWVMKQKGVSFRHAVELLRESYGSVPESAPGSGSGEVRELEWGSDESVSDAQLLGHVVDFYHGQLQCHPEAARYLHQRGLGDAELIRTFRIGVADRTLGARLPDKNPDLLT